MDELLRYTWVFLLAGFLGGLLLFARGLIAYRHDRHVESVATSSLGGIAAGEVRVSGTVEALASTLISPLQSRPCVWYRARVDETGENGRVLLNEERGQEFRLRDDTGTIRVLPKGARWEVGPTLDASTGLDGEDPVELRIRTGSSFAALAEREARAMTSIERDAAVQALLTVQPVGAPSKLEGEAASGGLGGLGLPGMATRRRRYREARVEIGDTITIMGHALPWADVRETLEAWAPGSNIERDIAGDLAEARAAGILASSPAEAWGNAAIPGFGIGRPTEPPDLHPGAPSPTAGATADEGEGGAEDDGAAADDTYRVPDDALVISRGNGVMAVYAGTPLVAETHHDVAFALGVAGAMISVVCALGLGAVLTGTL